MSGTNKKLSGFEFRKRAKEKAEKEENLLQKIRKLDSFFLTSPSPQKSAANIESTAASSSSYTAGQGETNFEQIPGSSDTTSIGFSIHTTPVYSNTQETEVGCSYTKFHFEPKKNILFFL